MSWQLVMTSVSALTGQQHITIRRFASTVAGAYDRVCKLHVDLITGGVLQTSITPDRKKALEDGIVQIMEQNLKGGNSSTNLLQQIGPHLQKYWAGVIIYGPNGHVVLNYTGFWLAPFVKQNIDFRIMIIQFIISAKLQIATLSGIYTSYTVTGLVTPWSGMSLKVAG